MGAYKPRTNPYAFQGYGAKCLPYVFELAGKHGIKVIAMEVTHESHVDEIREALAKTGHPTGVMLQIGTRNTQNFELLKLVGRQQEFPVLIKRGFGITLDESLNAAEYLASEGNRKVVFCLRGMKTNMGDPHRNFVDFAHVPVVKVLTRMPVCIDPSHSVGSRAVAPDGLLDVFHTVAQGVVAGANMVLVDFHPDPAKALVDGPQALLLSELDHFLADVARSHASSGRTDERRDVRAPARDRAEACARARRHAGADAPCGGRRVEERPRAHLAAGERVLRHCRWRARVGRRRAAYPTRWQALRSNGEGPAGRRQRCRIELSRRIRVAAAPPRDRCDRAASHTVVRPSSPRARRRTGQPLH